MKNKLTIYYMFFNYIDFNYFIISLTIGLFFVYIIGPEQPVILVYPTPDNQEKYQYVDKADNCYTFKAKETDCSLFSEQMDIPIQT
tara:strand:- start:684 stop:941 length:258 start_codon:yes stop_codon:yes gene_type:complete